MKAACVLLLVVISTIGPSCGHDVSRTTITRIPAAQRGKAGLGSSKEPKKDTLPPIWPTPPAYGNAGPSRLSTSLHGSSGAKSKDQGGPPRSVVSKESKTRAARYKKAEERKTKMGGSPPSKVDTAPEVMTSFPTPTSVVSIKFGTGDAARLCFLQLSDRQKEEYLKAENRKKSFSVSAVDCKALWDGAPDGDDNGYFVVHVDEFHVSSFQKENGGIKSDKIQTSQGPWSGSEILQWRERFAKAVGAKFVALADDSLLPCYPKADVSYRDQCISLRLAYAVFMDDKGPPDEFRGWYESRGYQWKGFGVRYSSDAGDQVLTMTYPEAKRVMSEASLEDFLHVVMAIGRGYLCRALVDAVTETCDEAQHEGQWLDESGFYSPFKDGPVTGALELLRAFGMSDDHSLTQSLRVLTSGIYDSVEAAQSAEPETFDEVVRALRTTVFDEGDAGSGTSHERGGFDSLRAALRAVVESSLRRTADEEAEQRRRNYCLRHGSGLSAFFAPGGSGSGRDGIGDLVNNVLAMRKVIPPDDGMCALDSGRTVALHEFFGALDVDAAAAVVGRKTSPRTRPFILPISHPGGHVRRALSGAGDWPSERFTEVMNAGVNGLPKIIQDLMRMDTCVVRADWNDVRAKLFKAVRIYSMSFNSRGKLVKPIITDKRRA